MARRPASGPRLRLSRRCSRASVRKKRDSRMNHRIQRRATLIFAMAAAAVLFVLPVAVRAQGGRGAAPTPKAAAPVDITGYWVALVTEDWRYRMMTPAKGDYPNIPLNPAGRRVADAWD